ncbi:MAG: hypothetical protein ACK5MG_08450 [Bacteroidales bacterium]
MNKHCTKNNIWILLGFALLSLSPFASNANDSNKDLNDKITITGVPREDIWPSLERFFNENGYSISNFNLKRQVMTTQKFTWKSLIVLNRANYIASFKDGELTLKIANREYNSDGRWNDATTKLSNAKKKEFLESAAKRIYEINNNQELLKSCKIQSYYYPSGPQETNVEDIEIRCASIEQSNKNINVYLSLKNIGDKRVIQVDGIDHSIIFPDGNSLSGKIDKVEFGDIVKHGITNKTLVGKELATNETKNICISFNKDGFNPESNTVHTLKIRLLIDKTKRAEATLYNLKINKSTQP